MNDLLNSQTMIDEIMVNNSDDIKMLMKVINENEDDATNLKK